MANGKAAKPAHIPSVHDPICVALVEDSDGLREAMSVLLNGTPGFRCVGAFATAEAALKELSQLAPHVILMDIHLPQMSGIACIRRLKDSVPDARIVMLTVFADRENIFQALLAGANGYLSKRTPPVEILKAIEDVHLNRAPMSSDIAARVVDYFNQKGAAAIAPDTHLSAREQEILELLGQGFLYKEIASELDISFDTVQWHIRNIYQKLHVRSRSEAIAKYLRTDPLK